MRRKVLAGRWLNRPPGGSRDCCTIWLTRRLLDGQFDECDITMRDLEIIERSVMKSLLAIYHGRIQYPSTAALVNSIPANAPAMRSA